MSFEIVNPPEFDPPKGWNHGLLAPAGGRVLFVAGQVAAQKGGGLVAGGTVPQWRQALENVLTVVRTAGGGPEDIGRMTIYITDRAAYLRARPELGAVWRELMGRHFPAVAVVEVSALVDEGAEVEIEATAVIPPVGGGG